MDTITFRRLADDRIELTTPTGSYILEAVEVAAVVMAITYESQNLQGILHDLAKPEIQYAKGYEPEPFTARGRPIAILAEPLATEAR